MVGTLSIVFMFLMALIGIALPVVTYFYFYRKYGISMKYVLIGAGVYIFFVAILQKFLTRNLVYLNEAPAEFLSNPYMYALYAGAAAAVFGETGRLLAMKLFMKDDQQWHHGMAYGIGHGGIQALYIGGLAGINNILIAFMINRTEITSDTPQQIINVTDQMVHMPSYIFAMGALERIFFFVLQLAFSLMILYAIRYHKMSMYGLAMFIHFAMITIAVMMRRAWDLHNGLPAAFLGIMAVLAFIFILKSKKLFSPESA